MSAQRANRWAGLAVTLFGVFLVGYAIPEQIAGRAEAGFSPALWPRILGWSFVAMGLLLVWQARPAVERGEAPGPNLSWEGSLPSHRLLPLLALTGLAFGYAWSIERIGYYVATAIFLPVGMALYGERHSVRLVLVDGAMIAALYATFELGLGLTLR